MTSTGPRFSAAARLAAADKRRERSRLAALTFNEPAVFALRAPSAARGYVWEIRKFGGVSVVRGTDIYETAAQARNAGMAALDGMRPEGQAARREAYEAAD